MEKKVWNVLAFLWNSTEVQNNFFAAVKVFFLLKKCEIIKIEASKQEDKIIQICGLYYKHILTIISDDRKWHLYYKCVIDDARLAS